MEPTVHEVTVVPRSAHPPSGPPSSAVASPRKRSSTELAPLLMRDQHTTNSNSNASSSSTHSIHSSGQHHNTGHERSPTKASTPQHHRERQASGDSASEADSAGYTRAQGAHSLTELSSSPAASTSAWSVGRRKLTMQRANSLLGAVPEAVNNSPKRQAQASGSGPGEDTGKKANNTRRGLRMPDDQDKLYGSSLGDAWRRRSAKQNAPRPGCVLMPDSTFRLSWNLVVFVLLVYTMLYLPVRLAFSESNYDVVDLVVDGLFFIDIVLTFFTAVEEADGTVISDHSKIASKYAKSWFLLDVLATFPFYLVIDTSVSRASALLRVPRLFKIFRLLRMLKLLRVARFESYLSAMEDSSDVHPGVFRLLKLLLWTIVIAHVCACTVVFIATLEGYRGGWISANDLATTGDLSLYNIALYWTFSTLTGTGIADIIPTNHTERAFSDLVMLSGVTLLAYATATIASVFQSLDLHATNLRVQMEALAAFMAGAKIPMELKVRVKKHLRYTQEHHPEDYEAEDILAQIPVHLRQEVLGYVHRDIFESCVFLRDLADTDFASDIALQMRHSRFCVGEKIARYGHPVTNWVVIKSGIVHAHAKDVPEPILAFGPGSTVGEIGLLLTGTWGVDLVAATALTIVSVPRRVLMPLLNEYPLTKSAMRELAKERRTRMLARMPMARDNLSTWQLYRNALNSLQESQEDLDTSGHASPHRAQRPRKLLSNESIPEHGTVSRVLHRHASSAQRRAQLPGTVNTDEPEVTGTHAGRSLMDVKGVQSHHSMHSLAITEAETEQLNMAQRLATVESVLHTVLEKQDELLAQMKRPHRLRGSLSHLRMSLPA